MAARRLFTLGELRLLDSFGQEKLPGRGKALALFAYIAQRSPRPIPRTELAELLWGNRPESRGRHSLRQALHELRGVAASALEITDTEVRVVAGEVVLDVEELAAAVAAGRWEDAVGSWGGEFMKGREGLGGEAFRTWMESERERARRLAATALGHLETEAGSRGEWGQAVVWAQRWTEIERYSEPAHARLIEALQLAGRREAATAALIAFQARLRSDLGEEPSAELLRLAASVEAARPGIGAAAGTGQSAALFSPDMVGRGASLGLMADAWRAAEGGAGTVVVVRGEEGLGRSRLCDEFLQWLGGSSDALVLRARAYVAEHDVSWAAARDLLAALAGASGLGGAPDDALAALSMLVPGIRSRYPHLSREEPVTEEAVMDGLLRVLDAVAAECPVVLLIDDFPAADASTRRLALSLARRPPDRLLLVLTGRADGRGSDPTLNQLREIDGVRWIDLLPLGLSDTEAMLDSMLALEPDARHGLALRLHAQAEGNPFYMVALVSALADAGHLAPGEGGVWRIGGDDGGMIPVPEGIYAAVQTRLEHLGADARHLMGAAAVLGRTIQTARLESIASLPSHRFCDAIEELISRRLLRPAPLPLQGYEFPNELVRRVTYELLSPARRRVLHSAAIETSEQGTSGIDQDHGEGGRRLAGRDRRPHQEPKARRRRTAAFATLFLALSTFAAAMVRGNSNVIAEDGISSRPASAQLLYQEGLAAFHRGDFVGAERFFDTALEEDSTYALAAYYLRRARAELGQRVSGDTSLTRALRWVHAAPEKERLLARALWGDVLQDPARFAYAESLAVRYPEEPDGHLLLGRAKRSRGDFLGAIPHFRLVVTMDSLGLDGRSALCRGCDAHGEAIETYSLADSASAAFRWAREWTERQPASSRAWNALAELLLAHDRFGEALEAKQRAVSLQPGSEMGPIFRARVALHSTDWATADSILRQAASGAADDVGTSALWWLTVSLREQGRLREALGTARSYRERVARRHAAADLHHRAVPYSAMIEAQVLFELGRYHASAALFDSIGVAAVAPESPGSTARARAWTLTHMATALAHAQDTVALVTLAERVRSIGAGSGYGRDWRLHHYVRGLLQAQRGRTADAEREFRRAMYSMVGFSRINLELARALLGLGHAAEAVALLEAASRGPLEADGLYLTRTELHLELARALEQVGQPGQAAQHYRRVVRAWAGADPELRDRRELAESRLLAIRH
jgi:DNA-binding SARP family transcriptional activator/Tfp pilus assembly protein PilF